MWAEFKEKTYEKYFGFELARLTNVTFSPDQCDEAFLGFDDAFFVPWPHLIGRFPHMRRSRWARLHGLSIQEFDRHIGRATKHMPPFRFNLFVQYKRPEYLFRSNAAEWLDWGNPYFRYTTTPHQQDLLEAIEQQSNNRAATVYASPAFWRADDLWGHVKAESVVDHSNIASVGRLRGHSRFSYVGSGCNGQGHSEATPLESTPFKQILETGMGQEGLPFKQHVKRAAKQIEETARGSDFAGPLLKRAREAIIGEWLEDGEAPTEGSLLFALTTIEAFSDIFDVSYYAIG